MNNQIEPSVFDLIRTCEEEINDSLKTLSDMLESQRLTVSLVSIDSYAFTLDQQPALKASILIKPMRGGL